MDEDAKLEWTRQLRDDLDGDGKIDFDEYLPPEVIKENDNHIRIDNTHDKSSLILMNARRNDAGKYMLKASSEAGEDEIFFYVRVIDIPGPPGILKI